MNERKILTAVILVCMIAVGCMIAVTCTAENRIHDKESRIASLEEHRKWQNTFNDAVMALILEPSDETIRKLKEIYNARRIAPDPKPAN